jgi:uncharacterized protein YceH (UPF0502 family)
MDGTGAVDDGPAQVEFSAPERRVLGCLIEKERATPQNYPLTLNSLRLACNQTTNRDPVTDYDDATIEEALASLRQQNLTRIVYSTSNRAAKYRHVLGDAWGLDGNELAVLAVLLLRGPQTLGEIKARTERLGDLADLAAVQATLERLAAGRVPGSGPNRIAIPLVVRHDRRPGQKDARWAHVLGGESQEWPDDGQVAAPTGPSAPGRADDEVSELRAEVDELRAELNELRAAFVAFRSEFS